MDAARGIVANDRRFLERTSTLFPHLTVEYCVYVIQLEACPCSSHPEQNIMKGLVNYDVFYLALV